MPSPTEHTERSGANSPSVFTSKHVSVKAGKETYISLVGSLNEKYFCCAQDDNVRCLLCSIVQKCTHKWNIKRHYGTVLCSKSAADAANLSIFTLLHVHCGLRCTTSSWGHIEYMIADACSRYTKTLLTQYLTSGPFSWEFTHYIGIIMDSFHCLGAFPFPNSKFRFVDFS